MEGRKCPATLSLHHATESRPWTYLGAAPSHGFGAAGTPRYPGTAYLLGGCRLPKRNYQFEKRQKDLDKKRKREEKRQRKLDRAQNRAEEIANHAPDPLETPPQE